MIRKNWAHSHNFEDIVELVADHIQCYFVRRIDVFYVLRL